jgi:hypothetical protein
MSHELGLDELPEDVLVTMFSTLPVSDLATLCLVNSGLHRIACDDAVWAYKCKLCNIPLPESYASGDLKEYFHRETQIRWNVNKKNPMLVVDHNVVRLPVGATGSDRFVGIQAVDPVPMDGVFFFEVQVGCSFVDLCVS